MAKTTVIVLSTPLTRKMDLRDFRAMDLEGFTSKYIWSRDRKRILGTAMTLLHGSCPETERRIELGPTGGAV